MISESDAATRALGAALGARLHGGEVILLHGTLGAGKTVFAAGIAAALGAPAWRGSPTFNLIHEYETGPWLYHADLYRLDGCQVEALGLEEYVRPDSVLVVEWPERAEGYLRSLASGIVVDVHLEHGEGDRRIARMSRSIAGRR